MARRVNAMYQRPGKGLFLVRFPAALSRKDVRSPDWEDTKADMLENLVYLYSDAFDQLKTDVENKR